MIKLSHLSNCKTVLSQVKNKAKSLDFCTDTRKYKHPSAFVAIPGAKVNPLDVMQDLLSQSCPLVFFQSDKENEKKTMTLRDQYPKTEFVAITDSVTFLQEISHLHIIDWKKASAKNTIFAISGSNGKTTHKEMLAFIMKSILPGKIVATEKNNNNHLGVPLTLLQVTEKTEFVVLELGSNHPGEIKVLCDIASPNAGLTTNIGATHLEFFGTEEKVFDEEGFLFHAINSVTQGHGFFLQNIDDIFLRRFSKTKGTIAYGEGQRADAKVTFQEHGAKISLKNLTLQTLNEHITGKHNNLNLITCVFIAAHFYPKMRTKIELAARDFRPTKNRSEWMDFEGRSVFLDAYNANPSSMKAALEGFKESVENQGHKLSETCVVLGDMNELGDSTPEYHREVGEYLKELGFENVYFVGRYASHYLSGFPQGHSQKSSAEFKSLYRSECIKNFPLHFIKGSRSLQLESLFDIT
jgi:UDP-N-acetylmuramoyl-tripeptide--D-alanyl-D-alanine ligase